ncbi:MAG: glutaminase A [Burkholderiales bacterium]|nr:glutaminase A [Burkholderiales bacterium]
MRKLYLPLVLSFGITAVYADNVNYQKIVDQAYSKYKNDNRGKVADYIPELAKYNKNLYAITLITVDGKVYSAGNVKAKFPLESISKIFALSLALQQHGADEVLEKIGSEATGLPFNSITAIEQQPTKTGNGLVNAGAIATISLINAEGMDDKWNLISNNLNDYANAKLSLNQDVYKSEMDSNQHNQAITQLLISHKSFYGDMNETLDIYTRECSVDVSTIELAQMASVLANNGKSIFNGKQLLNAKLIPKLLSQMATAGMYDYSGTWMYNVGIPAKSGVSGGIIAVVPGKYAIAAYSPPLDSYGNSVRAQEAIKYIAKATDENIFNTK